MSISYDIDKIPELSTQLGLTGRELLDFIREQNNAAREERNLERVEAEAQRQFALAEREHQIANPPVATSEPDICPIKLLPLKDSDDVTAYLTRFERVSTLYKWDDTRKALQLANLLQGRALAI